LGHAIGVLGSDVGAVCVADACCAVVERCPEDISVCFTLDGSDKWSDGDFRRLSPFGTIFQDSPIRPRYRHVSLDDTVNTNPLVFGSITLEGDTGMPANKATPTVRTDQVLATSAVSMN